MFRVDEMEEFPGVVRNLRGDVCLLFDRGLSRGSSRAITREERDEFERGLIAGWGHAQDLRFEVDDDADLFFRRGYLSAQDWFDGVHNDEVYVLGLNHLLEDQ